MGGGGVGAGRGRGGAGGPGPVDGFERRGHGPGDGVQVADGELALVELSLVHDLGDAAPHQLDQPLRRGLGELAGGGLAGVGDHDQAGLAGPRARTAVAEGGVELALGIAGAAVLR